MTSFLPVLFGADLNCYSLARCFYEGYGIKSVAFGKKRLGPIRATRFLSFSAVEGLEKEEIFLPLITQFAKKHAGKKLLLCPCTDEYAALLSRTRARLPYFCVAAAPPSVFLPFFDKSVFYTACMERGISIPRTLSFSAMPKIAALVAAAEKIGYPAVVKPSDSAAYWQPPLPVTAPFPRTALRPLPAPPCPRTALRTLAPQKKKATPSGGFLFYH